jgi:hypothetical protein
MEAAPWRPLVGDRVRVRDGVGQAIVCTDLPHDPAEQGQTGVVVGDRPRASLASHPYLVAFDAPVPIIRVGGRRMPLHVRHYAAGELERIDA